MFDKKDKKIWEIYQNLLIKLPKHPLNININDSLQLYKKAVEIYESYKYFDYIHKANGEINDNVVKNLLEE